jgi:hypothetical protein
MEFPGEQLVAKLWDSLVDKGVGGLLTPWSMPRKGRPAIDIKAEEIVAIARAEREADDIRAAAVIQFSAGRFFFEGQNLLTRAKPRRLLLPACGNQDIAI